MKATIKITGASHEQQLLIGFISKAATGIKPLLYAGHTSMNFDNVTEARLALAKANRLMKAEQAYKLANDGMTWSGGRAQAIQIGTAVANIETRKND